MLKPPHNQQQLQTIQFIKQIARDLQEEEVQSGQDSLMVSQSQISNDTVKINIKQQKTIKPNKYLKKYVSPYKQHEISIDKIQATGRKRINPKISFSNTLLQMATNQQKNHSRNSSQHSRYRKSPSLLQKIEKSALDRLRTQARQMYQIQQKQRKEIPPNKRSKMWAEFLLRQRKWQEQKKAKQITSKQEVLLNQRRADRPKVKEVPREVEEITRQNLIRKIKRQKTKLQQQLNSISPFGRKHVNIRGQKTPPKPQQSNRVRVSHSKQAAFLIKYGH